MRHHGLNEEGSHALVHDKLDALMLQAQLLREHLLPPWYNCNNCYEEGEDQLASCAKFRFLGDNLEAQVERRLPRETNQDAPRRYDAEDDKNHGVSCCFHVCEKVQKPDHEEHEDGDDERGQHLNSAHSMLGAKRSGRLL